MWNTPCKEIHILWVGLRPTAHVIWFRNKNTHERTTGPGSGYSNIWWIIMAFDWNMYVCVLLWDMWPSLGKCVLPCDSWRFPEGSLHTFQDIPEMKQITEKSTQLMRVWLLSESLDLDHLGDKYLFGKLTEIISSFLQWWDKSRMPLTKSLLALTYTRPASIIPLHSFTNWWTERQKTQQCL